MAKNCVDFFQRMSASKNPNSYDAPISNSYSFDGSGDLRTAEQMDRTAAAADAQFRDTAASAITEAMGPEDPTAVYPELERGDATRIHDIRQSLFRSDVVKARAEAEKHLLDVANRVNGNTVGEDSWWLHFTSWLARKVSNRRASFAQYLQLYQNDGTEGSILNRDLFSRLSHMEALINGRTEAMAKPHVEALDSLANEIAKEIGLPNRVNEVRQIIGDYAMFRHIIEDGANYALMDRFQRNIDRIDAMPPEERAKHSEERAKYEYWLDELSKHVDDENPPAHLVSVGFTDGEARLLMEEIRKLGIDENKLIRGSDELVKWNSELLEADAKSGNISPEQYDRIMANNFQYYVPVMHRANNATGYVNDTHPYYEANYRVREGSDDIPDDAYTSTLMRTKRVAGQLATKEVSTEFLAMAMRNEEARKAGGEDNGLRIYKMSDIIRAEGARDMGNEMRSDWANTARHSGGFVVNAPVRDANGNITKYERSLVYFAPNWKGRGGLTGAMLNDGLLFSQSTMPNSALGRGATQLNSLYGRAFTQYRPWFGIVNSGRDSFERMTHIAARDYTDANGNTVSGWKLLGRYAKNVASAYASLPRMMAEMKRGTFNMSSREGKLWQEFVQFGVHQDYTWGKDVTRYAEDVIAKPRGSRQTEGLPKYLQGQKAEGLRKTVNMLGERPAKAALAALDAFNDYWNNVAAFAHFKTLREANIPPERAARNTLDSMDFQQQGERTSLLRCFFPFVKPIAQSAASLSRVLGLSYDNRGFVKAGWKGWTMMAGLGIGLKGIMSFAQEQMGQDEDGNYRIDQLPLSKLSRGIPFGLGGENGAYFFLNTGYGLPRLLSTVLWGEDRVKRGLLDPSSYVGNVMLTFVQEMSPGNWPEFSFTENPADYIIQAVFPAFLSPVAEVATGRNNFGRELKRFGAPEGVAKSDYGGGSVEKAYHRMAQDARRIFGFDFYPEEIQHLVEGYSVGPAVAIRSVLSSIFGDDGMPTIRDTEHYKDTHLSPFLEMIGATMSFGYADDVARSLFNQAEQRIVNVLKDNHIRQASSTAYKRGDSAGQERWWRDQCEEAGIDPGMTDDIVRYFRAKNALKQGSKEVNAYLRGEIDNGIDYFDLYEKYEEATRSRRQIYRDFVNELNMYRR